MKREEDRLPDRHMFSNIGLLNDDPRTIFGVGGQQSTPQTVRRKEPGVGFVGSTR
jgi:hypothetical protein